MIFGFELMILVRDFFCVKFGGKKSWLILLIGVVILSDRFGMLNMGVIVDSCGVVVCGVVVCFVVVCFVVGVVVVSFFEVFVVCLLVGFRVCNEK